MKYIGQYNLALVRNIKVRCTMDNSDLIDALAVDKAWSAVKKLKISSLLSKSNAFVYKKSIDARDRKNIFLIYTIAFRLDNNSEINCKATGVEFVTVCNDYPFYEHNKTVSERPVVVGFGPSGMFCALALAKAGLRPIVVERGDDVDTRAEKVNCYWNNGVLDTNSNVQFGEGGAGTFSDGKLLTRISDKLCYFVLSELVRHGAPHEILYLAKPHIGTDNLRRVVKSIRNEIISLGGQVRFNSCFTRIINDSFGRVSEIVINNNERISCDSLFLCIGHSARDTVKSLMSSGVYVEPKPFSVGVRIEHLQSDIDNALYGDFAGAPSLGKAQYTLSKKFDNRAVYSFCMCPGGVVVASASDEGQIVTNGMSYYARDGLNANSAIAVSVDTSDYGDTVDNAIDFQERIERNAFSLAGSDGSAPIQLLGDFLNGTCVNEPSRILPTYTGKTVVRNADFVFPEFITNNLRRGLVMFERDINGFCVNDAVLTFPETRTSSPIRINRDSGYLARGFSNIYPCGEGAGYAGGITSAAVDGLRAAIAYLNS